MTSDWSPFAWQGIQIETPRAWELGAVTGDRRKGYFRLDDADMPRVEAKWESGSPGQSVRSVADRYLKKAGLAGAAGERQVQRNVRLDPPADMETEFFITRGDPSALHMAARCGGCGRVALLRVFYRGDEPLQPVMARLFASYRDHARGGKRRGRSTGSGSKSRRITSCSGTTSAPGASNWSSRASAPALWPCGSVLRRPSSRKRAFSTG